MGDRPTRIPRILTKPMSWVYGLGAVYKASQFDKGRGVARFDRPVISIGNLSTGGTGKTPMVHHVVRTLQNAGHRPVIAMRGYKAEPGKPGDEEMEHRSRFPEVPVVAQPDRIAGLRKLFSSPEGEEIDCVVLDDGFQHRQIARDLDIVLIDASRPPDRDGLLPDGYLREPVSALGRADVFVLTHAELVDEIEVQRLDAWLENQTGKGFLAHARHEWARILVDNSKKSSFEPPNWLCGKQIVMVCGIGNPGGVLAGIKEHGGVVVESMILRDHSVYDAGMVVHIRERIRRSNADILLCTQKDWGKLGPLWGRGECTVAVPQLTMGFGGRGEDLDDEILHAAGSNPVSG